MIKLNNNGFSLLQILVAVGLLSLVSLGVADLMVNSNRASKSMSTKMERLIFYTEVSNSLLTEKNCSDAIQNNPFNLTKINSVDGMEFSLNLPGLGQVSAGQDIQSTNLSVESLSMSSAVHQGVSAGGGNVYRVNINAKVKSKTSILGGTSLAPIPLPGIFVTVVGGMITNCSSELGVAYLCKQMDGVFDPSTNKCNVSPTPEEACNLVSGTYSSGKCFQTTYKDCQNHKHGETFGKCSGSGCGGKVGSYTQRTYICIDGKEIIVGGKKGRNHPSCFTAETKVRMADGSLKAIANIKVGEQVLGEDGKINNVIGIETPKLGTRLLFSLNGGPFFVTAEHPFKTLNGWRSFDPEMTDHETPNLVSRSPLGLGQVLLRYNDDLELLQDYQRDNFDEKMKVYNLLLDGNNTYFANDYLVHNKPG